MEKFVITAFSASLRNARSKDGAQELVDDIKNLNTQQELVEYLAKQGNLHLDAFYEAGRGTGISYDEVYKKLKEVRGKQGLSNSETCAAAALWGALQVGAEIRLVPLSEHFPEDGSIRDAEELRRLILETDGFVLSTPVYFGDRSSLAQRLIDFIHLDDELTASCEGKICGGVAVGAKRNGGQETCLIYQMHDMMQLGSLGVGNDYMTTSQYGGTGHAGDVGTMANDTVGIETSIGTGRRVASVTSILSVANGYRLTDTLKVGLFILQERSDELDSMLKPFVEKLSQKADVRVIKAYDEKILPCMGCDICPCRVGPDSVYRCTRGKSDGMHVMHKALLECDVVIPAMYSPKKRSGLVSVYQSFLERLRYLRRGDYALSNRLIVPLVFSEVGSNENLNMRMITSLIRHHTVMHAPIIGLFKDGSLLNSEEIEAKCDGVVESGANLTIGRLHGAALCNEVILYKPVGYVLSSTKDNADNALDKRQVAIQDRLDKSTNEFNERIVKLS